MKPLSIGVIIPNKNQSKTLERALKSASWCDEKIVIDDESTDESEEVAKRTGAVFLKKSLRNDFAKQRNYGLDHATTDWVLFLDADEYIQKNLELEIREAIAQTVHDGFYIPRTDIFMGKVLRYGETGSMKLLRLARREAGRWKRPIHEVWDGIQGSVGSLHHSILHESHASIGEFLAKLDRYTNMEVKYRKEQGEKFSLFQLIVYPIGKFIQNYIFRLGFLDGFPGLAMAYMMSMHSLILRTKMYSHD